jgi:superfamily I DNA and/or RNA helicase
VVGIESAFDGFIKSGAEVNLLDEQYRIPCPIARIQSAVSYGGRVTTYTSKDQIPVEDCMFWIDTPKRIEIRNKRSMYNEDEINAIQKILPLIKEQRADQTIAILSFYQQQVNHLKSILLPTHPDLDIGTVDTMQGQERDVVLISLVRTQSMGFIADIKRFNVAIGRAKRESFRS